MSDGPNYEKVFRAMQALDGTKNEEDRAIIKRFLRFYQDSPEFDLFIGHYSTRLPKEDHAEFGIKPVKAEKLPKSSDEMVEAPKKAPKKAAKKSSKSK